MARQSSGNGFGRTIMPVRIKRLTCVHLFPKLYQKLAHENGAGQTEIHGTAERNRSS